MLQRIVNVETAHRTKQTVVMLPFYPIQRSTLRSSPDTPTERLIDVNMLNTTVIFVVVYDESKSRQRYRLSLEPPYALVLQDEIHFCSAA